MSSSRSDPQPPERSSRAEAGSGKANEPMQSRDDIVGGPEDVDLLAIVGRADTISKDYKTRSIDRSLARSYRAWQNQHAEGSKYQGTAFKGRSRLFVPKSRSAVRKNLAQAAGALFSTEDVTSISATYEDDPQQRATASVIKADLEYRLSRTSARHGFPWFQIAMGAALDSQLTGVCISKQFWEYEEVDTGEVETVEEPMIDESTGMPMIDAMGQPLIMQYEEPVMRVVKDRPMVELNPIENASIDPAAPWHSPVQLGRWFVMRYPMGISDVKSMLASADKSGNSTWLPDVPDALLRKGRVEEARGGQRRVREGGGDRYEDTARAGNDMDIVWIQENFVRIGGKDWHFWSVGRHGYLSIIQETHEAYPEFGGERPYVMGVAQLDTHRIFPQSPVETWQPLQLELNDITNLRLDSLKRSIAPLAIARRGRNVDLQALARRGQPETVLMVDNMDDVAITSTPGPGAGAFQETSITNSNFDELAGVFSTSSVQQSRQLNETVGGMNLMSRSANSVSEFDLRIWIETWVEPVLRHLAHLVRHHESDEKVVALAGQQARTWQRYQYMPSLEDFDQCELTVRVNAGIGSADPIQKLQKLKFALEMLGPIMPEAQSKGITLNVESLIEEVMGSAGFRDGRRFFDFGEPPQEQGPPPEMVKIMKDFEARMAKVEADRDKADKMAMLKAEEIRSKERQSAADNDADITSSEIEWLGRLAQHSMGTASGDMRHASTLRMQESERAERYRVQQMSGGGGGAAMSSPESAPNGEQSNAIMPQIGQVLEQLIRQVGALSQQVSAQQQMLAGLLGGNGGPSPPAMQPMM